MKLGPVHILRDTSVRRLFGEMQRLRGEVQGSLAGVEQIRAEVSGLRTRLDPAPPVSSNDAVGAPPPPMPGQLVPILRDVSEGYVEPPTPKPSKRAMFEAMDAWVTTFTIDGQTVGGPVDQCNDPHLTWFLETIGGVRGKRVLELGPMEGAHSKTLAEQGAAEVVAIEGFRENWLKCLVIKEVFGLDNVRFLYGDFCRYVADNDGPPFDAVLASGVFYHQMNSPQLIQDLARVTDRVLAYGVVADADHPPGGIETTVNASGQTYHGRTNDYQGARDIFKNYLGGPEPSAVWLYPDELIRAFVDAGFQSIVQQPVPKTPTGPALLFVASKIRQTSAQPQ